MWYEANLEIIVWLFTVMMSFIWLLIRSWFATFDQVTCILLTALSVPFGHICALLKI